MADYGHKMNVSESSIEFPVEGSFSDINRISILAQNIYLNITLGISMYYQIHQILN